MTRSRVILRLWLLALFGLPALGASAQEDLRIVALIVTSEAVPERADLIAQGLGRVQAETLRVGAPTNAALRAQMRRFAKEAEQSDAAFVFIDMPVVTFETRRFVLPQDARLTRPTDLFTQSVPLRAFSRITALSERGGAVIVTGTEPDDALPEAVKIAAAAPAAEPGISEILFVPADLSAPVLSGFAELMANPVRVDLAALLPALAETRGATLSATPAAPVVLRAPIQVGAPPPPVVPAAAVAVPGADAPSLEELETLEQSLSPAVIRRLQRALRDVGHYRGLIDGIVGDQTRSAITAFQTDRSAEETGLLTPGQLRDLLARD